MSTFEKKSYITGEFRSKILEMLEKDSPAIVESKLADLLMDNFDPNCPIMPKRETSKKMKYRQAKKQQKYRNENSVLSICEMKLESKYYGCIEDVGISPFFVYYTTPLQKTFAKSERRKKWVKLSIDASGLPSKFSKEAILSERTGKPRRGFYYSMMLHGKNKSSPVYQMLSQTHSSQKISDWLLTWKNRHNNQKNPNEIVIDESAALLLSCVSSFTTARSVHEYLSQCFDHLVNGGPLPKCYIRLDRSHVIASLLSNTTFIKVFGQQKEARNFYLRLIGYLIQEPDFQKVANIIRDAFKMVYNRYSDETKERTMLRLIKTHKIYDEAKETKIEPNENDSSKVETKNIEENKKKANDRFEI